MKKILLTNGCSWTGGHEKIHDEDTGELAPQPDYVWPNQLATRMPDYTVKNIAIGGNSNDKICRQAIEYIENNQVDAVMIQWTAMHRKEVYVDNVQRWGNMCNHYKLEDPSDRVVRSSLKLSDIEDIMYAMHFDKSLKYTDGVLNNIDKIVRSATNDYFWQYSETDWRIRLLKSITTMSWYLEQKGIPYMYTSMSGNQHLPMLATDHMYLDDEGNQQAHSLHTDFEKILARALDLGKWTKRPLSFVSKGHIDETMHPTPKGHKMIAAELTREFKNING